VGRRPAGVWRTISMPSARPAVLSRRGYQWLHCAGAPWGTTQSVKTSAMFRSLWHRVVRPATAAGAGQQRVVGPVLRPTAHIGARIREAQASRRMQSGGRTKTFRAFSLNKPGGSLSVRGYALRTSSCANHY
jgi:hypothetical protein